MAVQFLCGFLPLFILPLITGEAAALSTNRGRVRVVGLVVGHGWVSSTVRVTVVESEDKEEHLNLCPKQKQVEMTINYHIWLINHTGS